MNNRVSRCAMFVTPTNPRFIDKAWTRGGDVYILDMEDSIAPAEKQRCRTLMRESIEKAKKGGASVYIRINKPFVDADLPYAVWPGVDRIMLPKTETIEELQHAHEIILRLEKERGIPPGSIELSPMIESALGAVNICELLDATPRKNWSQGGANGYDMAVNLGIEMFADFDQYAFPGAYVALGAMTRNVESVGAVFVPNTSGRVDQSDQAAKQAAALHSAGIQHAGALHPAFIEPLITGLSPTTKETAWANAVIEAFDELTDVGESVGKLNGRVIDTYENAMAKRTLKWASDCADKDAYKARSMTNALADQAT
jgi:citrate lyase subunit beta/citryl-CoA lyase